MTLQLPRSAVILALVVAAGACSRSGTDVDTQQVRQDTRVAAEKAGEKIADGWLVTKVQAQFFADDDIRARDIAVTARDGVVTLKGRVLDDNAHTQAVQIARNTDGVRDVSDQLTVGPEAAAAPATPTPPAPPAPASAPVATSGTSPDVTARTLVQFERDAQITSAVQAKYFLDDTVKRRYIEVDTSDGVVTLKGDVANEAERAQALSLARATDGVQRVEDALSVNPAVAAAAAPANVPRPDDTTIATQIKAQYFLDRDMKVGSMEVTSNNGVVTLEGTVPSQAAKDRAIEVARQTEGVMQVIDRLQVQRVARSSTANGSTRVRRK